MVVERVWDSIDAVLIDVIGSDGDIASDVVAKDKVECDDTDLIDCGIIVVVIIDVVTVKVFLRCDFVKFSDILNVVMGTRYEAELVFDDVRTVLGIIECDDVDKGSDA